MKKITVKHLVDFDRKESPRSRQTLINNLKGSLVRDPEDGGGNYWISAVSCLSRAFKDNSQHPIVEKIEELIGKIDETTAKTSKDMYQQNINILQAFEEFDFNTLKPNDKLTFLKKPKEKAIVTIERLPFFVDPHHVFTFEVDGATKIGAIWFLAKKNGFSLGELAMITDLLYRYLENYGHVNAEIAMDYCVAVDACTTNRKSYKDIDTGNTPSGLMRTISEMKKLI